MSRFGFCGPSYTLQSVNADCQLAMNLYPQTDESGVGKSAVIQLATPGTALFATAPVAGQGRGVFTFLGRTFAVAGTTLYEAMSNGSVVTRGTVVNDGNPVSWAANATQLIVAAGGTVYCLVLATNIFSTVTALSGIPIIQICYTDAFILALQANSQIFYTSALEDGTTWDLSNESALSVYADNVVSMIVANREPWFFGQKATQPYYDSGAANTPYLPIAGADIEEGCIATFSTVRLDNSIFWLDGNVDRGQGIVRRAVGYTPTRISTHAVEVAIQGYSKITDAIGYGYQDQGHSFYVLYFPTANATWVYDVATQLWHQRGYGDEADSAHRSMAHTMNFGMHLVCDPITGNLNQMSSSIYTDAGGQLIKRIRRAPHISTEQTRIYHSQLQVDVQVGIGPIPPLQPGNAPPTLITLADSYGNLWSVGVTDAGLLTSTPASSGNKQTVILNDSTNTYSYSLGITALGLLTTTSIPFSSTGVMQYSLITNTGQNVWNVSVTSNGQLQTVFGNTIGRGPQMILRWSNDGGHTWSNEYARDCGQAGQYKKRVIWRRLGQARDRVYEVSMTDPVFWAIIDAYLEATPGFTSQERLPKSLAKIA